MTTLGDRRTGAPRRPTTDSVEPLRWLTPVLVILAFLVAAGALGGQGAKLGEVQRNDSAAYLPGDAEATRVLERSKRFSGMESTAAVVVYAKPSGITEQDRIEITLAMFAVADYFDSRLAGPPRGPLVSDDGQAAQVVILFAGSDPALLRPDITWLRERVAQTPGLTDVHVAGPAAAVADLTEVFGAVNGVLLLITGALILLILIVVYRSPLLPFVVLGVAGTALGLANGTVYLLAKAGVVTVSGDAQGILDVLVLGAGTDYALLLTARFREELRERDDKYEAMRSAWRASLGPVLASGGTVIFALLCLLASGLASTRGLGPVAAIGIGCALVSMLALLPAVLVLFGRTAFWPYRWRPLRSRGPKPTGWVRLAGGVGRRPRLVWVLTVLALGGLCLGLFRLEAHGVPRSESFLADVDSNAGQDVLTRHFPESSGTPAVIIARADQVNAVASAAALVPGVARATLYVDLLERIDARNAGRPEPGPKVVDGLIRVDATLAVPADSDRAKEIVTDLRRAVRAVPGAQAEVGGYTAANLDIQRTAQRDRWIIIPLVLLVVFLILAALLRAVVAALLLTATVILSYLATLGVCGVVFRDVFGFAGADSSFPLFAFVFLVALGVDYNIFLMSRVREEVDESGHRAGTLAGLAVTGGVITSAGVVLAATFAALGVLPLVFLAQLAFAVAFGVLLDTLVVRTLLVPALTVDIGRFVWWPGRLRRADP
jgi:RND superfamily putative drug exporter